ncbi:hypothetical protein [Marinoscillum sp. MHG1-6]|uniref:hypothetical protein n=1 Tax=Marinoscillum sp. MHG1-6 TaxID=2959627 RepID=UPI002157EA9B|nr:hypothetical protein [Marinoscillum sp. MHG1-6]
MPKIKPKDKLQLVPFDSTIGSIAEETHFFIDYSNHYAVLCVEYNYHGPRISDIEYYFRNIARYKLKLSKKTEVAFYMDAALDTALNDLENVLNIDVKVKPKKLAQVDTDIVGSYFTGISTLGQKLQPKFVKLEMMYQTAGSSKMTNGNTEAKKMVKNIMRRFKAKPYNIDGFENFVVKYEDKDGAEQVFNLLKGKKELILQVDLKKIQSLGDWYELIEEQFTETLAVL